MQDYHYTVVVTAGSREEADTVIRERVFFDEDYGFPYEIAVSR